MNAIPSPETPSNKPSLREFKEWLKGHTIDVAQRCYEEKLRTRDDYLEQKKAAFRRTYPSDEGMPWSLLPLDIQEWGNAQALGLLPSPVERLQVLLEEDFDDMSEETLREVKKIYVELGMAKLLVWSDWKVNRLSQLYKEMGVKSMNHAQVARIDFLRRIGADLTADGEKHVSLRMGSGTGVALEATRNNTDVVDSTGKPSSDYFEEIGIADRIYYPLEDLLRLYLRPSKEWPEGVDEDTVNEFIETLSSWILLEIDKQNKSQNTHFQLHRLPHDINALRDILLNLGDVIKGLSAKISSTHRQGSREFMGDCAVELSGKCTAMLASIFLNKDGWKLCDIFKANFFDTGADLREQVPIFPRNVVLSMFQDAKTDVFKNMPDILVADGRRSTSHLDDQDFQAFVRDVAEKLAPGGCIYADDGVQESYTRYKRIEQLTALGVILGDEYRIRFICSSDDQGDHQAVSYRIERGIRDSHGKIQFSNEDETARTLEEGFECLEPGQEIMSARTEFRLKVIHSLRELFIGSREETQADHELISTGRRNFTLDLNEHIVRHVNIAFDASGEDAKVDTVITALAKDHIQVRHALEVRDNGGLRWKYPDRKVVGHRRKVNTDDLPEHLLWGPEFRMRRVPRGTRLAGFTQFMGSEEQRAIQARFNRLSHELGRPGVVIWEFAKCFTNQAMRDTWRRYLGNDFERNVEVRRMNRTARPEDYIRDLDKDLGRIHIIGGSTDDVYSDIGKNTMHGFMPLFEAMAEGRAGAVRGVCYGDQVIRMGMAELHRYPYVAGPGALQYGIFPVKLMPKTGLAPNIAASNLDQANEFAALFTRRGYVHMPHLDEHAEITKWADFPSWGRKAHDPVGLAYDWGQGVKVIACAAHIEAGTSAKAGVREFADGNVGTWSTEYNPIHPSHDAEDQLRREIQHQVNMHGIDKWGRKGVHDTNGRFIPHGFVQRKAWLHLIGKHQLPLMLRQVEQELGLSV